MITGTFGEGGHLTIDEKALGVGRRQSLSRLGPRYPAVVLAAGLRRGADVLGLRSYVSDTVR